MAAPAIAASFLQYYSENIKKRDVTSLQNLYSSSSIFNFTDENKENVETETRVGAEQIAKYILNLPAFASFSIESMDATTLSVNNAILIVTTGTEVVDVYKIPFVRTFVLAEYQGKYYVSQEILRYKKSIRNTKKVTVTAIEASKMYGTSVPDVPNLDEVMAQIAKDEAEIASQEKMAATETKVKDEVITTTTTQAEEPVQVKTKNPRGKKNANKIAVESTSESVPESAPESTPESSESSESVTPTATTTENVEISSVDTTAESSEADVTSPRRAKARKQRAKKNASTDAAVAVAVATESSEVTEATEATETVPESTPATENVETVKPTTQRKPRGKKGDKVGAIVSAVPVAPVSTTTTTAVPETESVKVEAEVEATPAPVLKPISWVAAVKNELSTEEEIAAAEAAKAAKIAKATSTEETTQPKTGGSDATKKPFTKKTDVKQPIKSEVTDKKVFGQKGNQNKPVSATTTTTTTSLAPTTTTPTTSTTSKAAGNKNKPRVNMKSDLTVFVKDIPGKMNRDEFMAHFFSLGATQVSDFQSGGTRDNSSQYAFVEFENKTQADFVIEQGQISIYDHKVTIEKKNNPFGNDGFVPVKQAKASAKRM